MKFLRYIVIPVLFPFAGLAQNAPYTLPAQVGELATYVPTSTPISGQKYVLPGEVHSYYFDAGTNEIILLVKKQKEINIGAVAELMVFDMIKAMVKWSAPVNSLNVYVCKKYIISSEGGSTRCYDRNSGKQLWKKTDAKATYIDKAKGLLVTDHMRGLDLQSGKVRWQKYIPVRYKWEDVRKVDDSSVLVASGGLYRINLYTGKGWNTNEITSKEEFESPSAIGIVPPRATFPAQTISEMGTQIPSDKSTTSNIAMDEQSVYLATNRRLLSVDKQTGQLNWSATLPFSTGISSLYVNGDQLILVSHGSIADKAGTEKKYGKAYIARYAKTDGKELSKEDLSADGVVNQIMAKPGGDEADKLLVLFDKALYAWKESKSGRSTLSDDTTSYHSIPDESIFCNALTGNNSGGIYLVSARSKLSYFDWSPMMTHFPNADAMVCEEYGGYTVQYNGANTVLKGEESLVQTPETNRGFVHKEKLYIVAGQNLSVIPLAK